MHQYGVVQRVCGTNGLYLMGFIGGQMHRVHVVVYVPTHLLCTCVSLILEMPTLLHTKRLENAVIVFFQSGSEYEHTIAQKRFPDNFITDM